MPTSLKSFALLLQLVITFTPRLFLLDIRSQAEPAHLWRAHLRLGARDLGRASNFELFAWAFRCVGQKLRLAAHFEVDLPISQSLFSIRHSLRELT